MDSDRQNIKWVPLMEQIPSRLTFRGTCHEVRPSHAGSWTITLRQTASGTADTCRVRFACFLQTCQFSPSATSIHSNNYCKALRGPLQHAPSAVPAPCIGHRSVMHQQGGHPACPGTTLPMAEQSCPPCPKECYRAVFHTFIIWQAACPRGFLMPLLALCEALCLIIRRGKGHSVSIFLPRLKEKS